VAPGRQPTSLSREEFPYMLARNVAKPQNSERIGQIHMSSV